MSQSGNLDIGQWLKDNHKATNVPVDGGREVYHVFARNGYSVYGAKERYSVDFSVPIGPVVIKLVGYIDTSSLEAGITCIADVPILPDITLGELVGNLKDGISLEVGVSGVAEGSIGLYIKDGALWIKFALVVFGEHYESEFELFDLPFV